MTQNQSLVMRMAQPDVGLSPFHDVEEPTVGRAPRRLTIAFGAARSRHPRSRKWVFHRLLTSRGFDETS